MIEERYLNKTLPCLKIPLWLPSLENLESREHEGNSREMWKGDPLAKVRSWLPSVNLQNRARGEKRKETILLQKQDYDSFLP